MKKIDLHCHSTFSDGDYTPAQLLEMAATKGLAVFALTDHDTVNGVPQAAEAASRWGIEFIPGTEISIEYPSGTFHLLGYLLDHRHPGLNRLLELNQDSRGGRSLEWVRLMQERGLDVTVQELADLAGGQLQATTKLHAAQLLMKKGIISDKDDAFAEGGPLSAGGWLNVERRHLSLEEGIGAIHAAGGRALVAHPYTLNLPDYASNLDYFRTLKARGLDGLEVYHSDHTPEQIAGFLKISRELDFFVSGGSDFHGHAMPGVEMFTGRGNMNIRIEGIVRARDVNDF